MGNIISCCFFRQVKTQPLIGKIEESFDVSVTFSTEKQFEDKRLKIVDVVDNSKDKIPIPNGAMKAIEERKYDVDPEIPLSSKTIRTKDIYESKNLEEILQYLENKMEKEDKICSNYLCVAKYLLSVLKNEFFIDQIPIIFSKPDSIGSIKKKRIGVYSGFNIILN